MRIAAGLVAGAALGALACGGKPEICPNGDCTTPGTTVAQFRFDHYPQWGVDNDSCSDLAIGKVHVDATDAMGKVTSQDVPCEYGQATFTGLPPGDYTIAVTPLDSHGKPLVTAPITGVVTAADRNKTAMTMIDIPYTAWTTAYTGTFLFWLSWGGATCASAVPPVATQVVKLAVNGQGVGATTDTGQRLDGTDPEACRPLTDAHPQFAIGVPFGPAELTVVGEDGSGAAVFQHTFDTFVGAGTYNPTLTFDLSNAPADAGVDAPMDATGDAGGDAMPDSGP